MIPDLQALVERVASYERAWIEMRRAENAGTQPRMQKAGNRLAVARYRMFEAARKLRSLSADEAGGDPDPRDRQDVAP
jgi:hypothetical protein